MALGQAERQGDLPDVVNRFCDQFAEPFGASSLAGWLGQSHDLGKACAAWQEALRAVAGTNRTTGVPHKAHAAFVARSLSSPAASLVAASALLGHHWGMPDRVSRDASRAGVIQILKDTALAAPVDEALATLVAAGFPDLRVAAAQVRLPGWLPLTAKDADAARRVEMFTRMSPRWLRSGPGTAYGKPQYVVREPQTPTPLANPKRHQSTGPDEVQGPVRGLRDARLRAAVDQRGWRLAPPQGRARQGAWGLDQRRAALDRRGWRAAISQESPRLQAEACYMTTVHTQASSEDSRGRGDPRVTGTTLPAASANRPVRLPRPPHSRLLRSDLWAAGLFVIGVTLALWVRNGGVGELVSGGMGTVTALGEVSGLAAALAALGAILLTARPALIERRYGLDGLLRAHRWFGMVTVVTVLAHGVLDTWAWLSAVPGLTPLGGWLDLMLQPWMVAANVSAGLFLIIGLTSWRRIKRKLTYETWYFVHLLGYLAVLAGFGHQLVLGSDLSADPVMYWWWVALFAATFVGAAWSRLASLMAPLRSRFYVTAITREAPGAGALHLTGPGLRTLRASAGQFFVLRPLTRELWWQAHPFSLSVPPNTAGLRFTIKELGDDTPSFLRLPLGTRVLLEGPYGVFTAAAAQGEKVILFGGGVGMAPIRAILEDCRPHQQPVVVARVHSEPELVHRDELHQLVKARGGHMHVLAGPRTWFADRDPFSAAAIRAAVPDIAERHAFVCGPKALETAIVAGLRQAGVPSAQIHVESFGE